MTEIQKEEYRAAARERKSHEKMRSKSIAPENTVENTSMIPVNTYASRQSFGRALQRSRKSLPISPGKRLAVVQGLVAEVGINLNEQIPTKKVHVSFVPEETKDII